MSSKSHAISYQIDKVIVYIENMLNTLSETLKHGDFVHLVPPCTQWNMRMGKLNWKKKNSTIL